MYLDAMDQVGASTLKISQFIEFVRYGNNLEEIHDKLKMNDAVVRFLRFTFDVIESGKPHVASAFTFGREDLIPDMFFEIVKAAEEKDEAASYQLTYYLKRHIELDGGDHGPLALKMIAELCGDEEQKWNEVVEIAKDALRVRIALWDAIADEISKNQEELAEVV